MVITFIMLLASHHLYGHRRSCNVMYYFVFIKGLIIMCLISTICFISLSLSIAAEIQTQNESTEYPGMNKISPRQFVVNVEKKEDIIFLYIFPVGKVSVSLLMKILWKRTLKRDSHGMTKSTTT